MSSLRLRCPGARYLALASGSAPATGIEAAPTFSLVPTFEFLPDALVLETWWRAFPRDAHQVESWRGLVGGGCKTDDFLLAARRAWYLSQQFQREFTRPWHLHAIGPAAVLCAFLLARLDAVGTASFFLAPGMVAPGGETGFTGATLRRLAPAFVGGWIVGERKLAVSLGAAFHEFDCSSPVWVESLIGWAATYPTVR